MKSGSGEGGEGRTAAGLVPASEPRALGLAAGSSCGCSCTALLCFAPLLLRCPPTPRPRTLSSGPNSRTPVPPVGRCCRLHPGSRARAGLQLSPRPPQRLPAGPGGMLGWGRRERGFRPGGRRPPALPPASARRPPSRGPFKRRGRRPRGAGTAPGAGRAYSMEVCYQLPVLPLDRPVPQHVLSRRGAVAGSSSRALRCTPIPGSSQVNAAAGGPHLGAALLFTSFHPGFTSATPLPSPRRSPPTSTSRCLGMSRLTPSIQRLFSDPQDSNLTPPPTPACSRLNPRWALGTLRASPGATPLCSAA